MPLKLRQKGLILVAVPLIFELVSIYALAQTVKQSDFEAQREERSRAVVTEATNLHASFLDAGMALIIWRFTRNSAFVEKYDAAVAPIPTAFERLDALTSADERQKKHVVKLKEIGTQLLDLLTKYGRPNAESDSGFTLALADWNVYRKKLTALLEPFEAEIKLFINEERRVQDEYQRATQVAKRNTQTLTAVVVAISFVITIALSVFFSRSITERLQILTDNSFRIARRQALNEPLPGADEISNLDSSLHDMERQLRLADQQKQEFVSMISHDLSTPLTALQATLVLVAEGTYGDLSDLGKTRMVYAERSLSSIIHLLNQLIDVDRIESGMLELDKDFFSLSPLLNHCKESLLALSEEKKVAVTVADNHDEIYADRNRMSQVLINLVSNAVKYSPEGSEVRLESEIKDGFAFIRVIDRGPGVPAEFRDKIFDRFQQVEAADFPQRPGRGLGLAISKLIVEAHGGTIGVDSNPEGGSIFWMKLPANG